MKKKFVAGKVISNCDSDAKEHNLEIVFLETFQKLGGKGPQSSI